MLSFHKETRGFSPRHTSQKSQGWDILHHPSCILELICPQSHTPRLLQVPDGEWKQMAAPDRVGAQSCLAPGVQVLHSLTGLRLHLWLIKSWGVGCWGLWYSGENSAIGDVGSKWITWLACVPDRKGSRYAKEKPSTHHTPGLRLQWAEISRPEKSPRRPKGPEAGK